MKRYFSFLFCVLLSVVPLMGIPYEQTAEYAQKQAILNERAAKFKAETGFKGSISFDHRFMQFSHLSGTFNGMEVTTPQDTTSMLQIFTQIISTISPYIAASETDLHLEYISLNERRSAVRYRQIVNGYRFDGCGWLSVSYLIGQNKISVTNCTVPIREDFVAPTVTRERALEIYRDSIVGYENKLSIPVTPRANLKYYDVDQHIKDMSPSYRLCWIISGDRFVVIDAVSEKIYVNRPSYVLYN